MNPNKSELYAAISGVSLEIDEFDFEGGITIKTTYAHIMAPFIAAFSPPKRGKPHPPPWKAVSGGMGFDVTGELHIPLDSTLPKGFDNVNTVWWFVALMRLIISPKITVTVITDKSFSEIPLIDEEPHFWPIEMKPSRLIPVENPAEIVNVKDLEWIRKYWLSASSIMNQNDNFNFAFQAIDQCIWSPTFSLALILLWGALERLFSPSHHELRFRVSATIASYLKPPGQERHDLYRKVKKLYDDRSKAAHGSQVEGKKSVIETYSLLKSVLIMMIEKNHVPSKEELEALLFGYSIELKGRK